MIPVATTTEPSSAWQTPRRMPGVLWVTQQGKERVSFPTPHGTTGFVYFVYHVVVTYEQPDPRRSIDFSIQGGGMV